MSKPDKRNLERIDRLVRDGRVVRIVKEGDKDDFIAHVTIFLRNPNDDDFNAVLDGVSDVAMKCPCEHSVIGGPAYKDEFPFIDKIPWSTRK
jgi:hypothetical protein